MIEPERLADFRSLRIETERCVGRIVHWACLVDEVPEFDEDIAWELSWLARLDAETARRLAE